MPNYQCRLKRKKDNTNTMPFFLPDMTPCHIQANQEIGKSVQHGLRQSVQWRRGGDVPAPYYIRH